jgi:hypothetical protein
MDVYLGEHPSTSNIEHQEGYVLICERFYKEAEPAVLQVTERMLREKFSGRGRDADAALKAAIAKATDGLLYGYFMNTSNKALRVSRAFDLVSSVQKDKSLVAQVVQAFTVADLNQGMFNSSSKKPQQKPELPGIRPAIR